jgi:hypothetical protein
LSVLLSHPRTLDQSKATTCACGSAPATAIPKRPRPAAISSTVHFWPADAPRSFAIASAGAATMGPIDRANSTQAGFSGTRKPSSPTTVPPLQTPFVRSLNAFRTSADARKFTAVPRYAGEFRSRYVAESGVRL